MLVASHTLALAETIKFGVTAGPHAQIAEAIVPVAKAKGLDIQIVEFSDGALIDPATNDGIWMPMGSSTHLTSIVRTPIAA